MSKLERVHEDWAPEGYLFECPGCGHDHVVEVVRSNGHPGWTFNGDLDKPTFEPSLLVRGTRKITDEEHKRIMAGEKLDIPKFICHSFITDGNIKFLDDCTHSLKGQTVPLKEIE